MEIARNLRSHLLFVAGFGAARHVLRLQDRRGLSLQGAAQAEEEVAHCKSSTRSERRRYAYHATGVTD